MLLDEMPEIPAPDNVDLGGDGNTAELDDEDNFEDAIEIPTHMDLHSALNDCAVAIQKFFNNDIKGAESIMKPWQTESLYHAHGACIFEFIPAVLTMDPEQIQKARRALENTFDLYERERRTSTLTQALSSIVKKPNYTSYTDIQAHAELINAEAQLIVACLGAIECEDMGGLLRASIRIRSSYSSYKHCAKLLEKKVWENDLSRWHFSSGVKLGLATFNVMIAMMPPKLITLLEFVGFTANKEEGLSELLEASDLPGLRSVLCRMTFLAYHLVIGHFASVTPDFIIVEKVLRSSLELYPKSVWFLLFKGRFELLNGMIPASIITYNDVFKTPNLWKQIHHLAHWESMWANIMMLEWRSASKFVDDLVHSSKWSTTIYMYLQAAVFIELNSPNSSMLSINEVTSISALLETAPKKRQKIMGRSVPMEKFVERRCQKWAKNGFLVLPGIEMLCLFNLFPAVAKDAHYSDKLLKVIELTKDQIDLSMAAVESTSSSQANLIPETKPNNSLYSIEDKALVCFLLGSLLSTMKLPRLALRHLEQVIKIKDQIKESRYLVPYSTVEAAMCHFELGNIALATSMLNDARRKYSGYILDSRLHFRIHAKLNLIRSIQESN